MERINNIYIHNGAIYEKIYPLDSTDKDSFTEMKIKKIFNIFKNKDKNKVVDKEILSKINEEFIKKFYFKAPYCIDIHQNDFGLHRGVSIKTNEFQYGTVEINGYKLNIDGQAIYPNTLGKYTNIKSVCGKLIYEGDIVSVPVFQGYDRNYLISKLSDNWKDIKEDYGCYGLDGSLFLIGTKSILGGCNIIGNVYKNPGLLCTLYHR